MKRIFLETRSSRLYTGIEIEQDYDQRVICQAGKGHLVITTHPYDPDYLTYWEQTGFSMPQFITAGPFDPECTLSQLILKKEPIQEQIRSFVGTDPARLEYFFIKQPEARLSETLGIAAYCNVELSLRLSGKIAFKHLCDQLGIPTLPWLESDTSREFIAAAQQFLQTHGPILIKSDDGTGGVECGGMIRADHPEALDRAMAAMARSGVPFLLEPLLRDKAAEGCLHWEVTEQGELKEIGFFEMLEVSCSYAGAFYPSTVSQKVMDRIREDLHLRLGPWLIRNKALGYYTCDILIDGHGTPYWTDFNPRKGATLYIWDMVCRAARQHFHGAHPHFWYEHYLRIPKQHGQPPAFSHIQKQIQPFLTTGPSTFVVITNPGLIRHGFLDLVGISSESVMAARKRVHQVKSVLDLQVYGAQPHDAK